MRMFNADGGEAEMCGNGIRCVAKYAYEQGLARKRRGDKGVRFHGYVAEEDIPAFFVSARLSVFDYQATTGSSMLL